jgi:hypothetical protein
LQVKRGDVTVSSLLGRRFVTVAAAEPYRRSTTHATGPQP